MLSAGLPNANFPEASFTELLYMWLVTLRLEIPPLLAMLFKAETDSLHNKFSDLPGSFSFLLVWDPNFYAFKRGVFTKLALEGISNDSIFDRIVPSTSNSNIVLVIKKSELTMCRPPLVSTFSASQLHISLDSMTF